MEANELLEKILAELQKLNNRADNNQQIMEQAREKQMEQASQLIGSLKNVFNRGGKNG